MRRIGLVGLAAVLIGATASGSTAATAPAYDSVAGAIEIRSPQSVKVSMLDLTSTDEDIIPGCAPAGGGNSAWFRFIAPASGLVSFSAISGNGTNPTLTAVRGTPGSWTTVGCGFWDENRNMVASVVETSVAKGETLYLRTTSSAYPEKDGDYGGVSVQYIASAAAEGMLAVTRSNQIYLVKPDGTPVTTVVPRFPTTGLNYRPAFSPNGRYLAFVHEEAGRKDLWLSDLYEGASRQLTSVGTVTSGPQWAPDSQRIATSIGGALTVVHMMAPHSAPIQLQGWYTGGWRDESPTDQHSLPVARALAWSPDGTQIAFASTADAYWDELVYRLDLRTGEAHAVWTSGGDEASTVAELGFDPVGRLWVSTQAKTPSLQKPTIRYIDLPNVPLFPTKPGDRAIAGSPANSRTAVVNAGKIYVMAAGSTTRQLLTTGYQVDWQPVLSGSRLVSLP